MFTYSWHWSEFVYLVALAIGVGVAAVNISRFKVFQFLRERLLNRAYIAQSELRDRVELQLIEEWRETGKMPTDARRRYLIRRAMPWGVWIYYLLSCPYCTGHYVSLGATFLFQVTPLHTGVYIVDLGATWFMTIFFGIMTSQAIFRSLGDYPDVVNLNAEETFANDQNPVWLRRYREQDQDKPEDRPHAQA